MNERHTRLNVRGVDYDKDNPRIKMALEKYGDKLDAQRIHFALRSATEGETGNSSYSALRDSIRASKGALFPVTAIKRNGRYVCIDGNTRLAIHKEFLDRDIDGNWGEIKAVVLENADQRDIEAVRVSAHLVGSRQWPAYEKARFLHYLRYTELMDYNEMIALCGGNRSDIEKQIEAYHDMNDYYRNVVDDSAFRIDRFSGFVQLQRPGIKDAIFEAGFDLKEFGEWISTGRIYRLQDVRKLPQVLGDEEATEIFRSGGPRSIEEALRFLDRKAENAAKKDWKKITLEEASLHQLVLRLAARINGLTFDELLTLKQRSRDSAADEVRALEDLDERIRSLLDNVSE